MDYIEEIFKQHAKIAAPVKTTRGVTFKDVLTLETFRAAVQDIEADHLKRVCKKQ